MSMRSSPTFSASNTREPGISGCTRAPVVVLPAPWVPLSQTITGPTLSPDEAEAGPGASTAVHRARVTPESGWCDAPTGHTRAMRFRTTVVLGGKTATGLRVPEEVVADLGGGKRPAVLVTVGPHTYRSTVAVMGGAFMIPLSAENRAAAGVSAGDEVDVELEPDTAPREVAVPAALAAALDAAGAARRRLNVLSSSSQRQWGLPVEAAKAPETRRRRIDKAVSELRQPTA